MTATAALEMPRVAKRRTTWAQRTAQHTKAAKVAAEALIMKPALEDENGFLVREWSLSDKLSVKIADIATTISRQRAFEVEEMLETLPISGVKKAIYAGWLVKDPVAPWFLVTTRARAELNLPRKDRDGRTIKFLDAGRFEPPANGFADKVLKAAGYAG